MSGGPAATAREIGRAGVRKLLQRTGIVNESGAPLPTDPDEVVELLAAPWYDERLVTLAQELGRDPDDVRAPRPRATCGRWRRPWTSGR